MRTEGKIRIAAAVVILIVFAYFSIGYTVELFHLGIEKMTVDVDNMDGITVDGKQNKAGLRRCKAPAGPWCFPLRCTDGI